MKHFPVDFTFSACIWGCLLLLLAPLDFVFSFYTAAAIHEFCHILVLRLFHAPIYSITLGINGAVIQTAPLHPKQEFICAAAGPAGSFLCVLLLKYLPLIAIFGLVQGIYNLLPIYPMDGARLIRCFCEIFCPHCCDFICAAVTVAAVAVITGVCFYLYLRTASSLFLFLALYFLFQTCTKRKIPCKEA